MIYSESDPGVDVLLQGGPAGVPERYRASVTDVLSRKIKIPFHGGREHFELVDDRPHASRLVFRWTMRTEAAE